MENVVAYSLEFCVGVFVRSVLQGLGICMVLFLLAFAVRSAFNIMKIAIK